MLVYWIHKAGEAAGDRMRLDRRIPSLVSTFKYTRRRASRESVQSCLFLTSAWGSVNPPVCLADPGSRYIRLGRSHTLLSMFFPMFGGGLASETTVYIANLTLELVKLPDWHLLMVNWPWNRFLGGRLKLFLNQCYQLLAQTDWAVRPRGGQFCINHRNHIFESNSP